MSLRRPSLAWILLTGPTLLLGAALLYLLGHEARRLGQVQQRTATQRAHVVAKDIRVELSGWQAELENLLRELADDPAPEACWALESTHPLVRGTLVVDASGGVSFPDAAAHAQPEERRRLRRYDALLTGRVPWQQDGPAEDGEGATGLNQRWSAQSLKFRQERAYQQQAIMIEYVTPVYWHPWQWEDRQYLLGTVATREGGWCAVEVEVVALLGRLHDVLPEVEQHGGAISLQTLDGGVVHRRVGGGTEDMDREELARVMVGSLLPRYQVVVSGPVGAGQTNWVVYALAVPLALLLPAAIWAGAWLMRRESNRHLEDARKKTTFVSNVSHELKTPLTSIRMYAELLEEGRMAEGDKREKALRTIANESRRLSRLVDNVLDFSRLEQNRRQWNPQTIDLAAWLGEHAADLEWRCSDGGLAWTHTVPAGCPAVWFDPDGLEQVVLNLVDNACKYAGEGEGVTVEVVPVGSFVELRVLDRGPGIPAAQREKIFEQFHRIDDSLTSSQSGTGLGLSIARRLAERGGGRLVVRPREGGGSAFILQMPVVDQTRSET